MAGMAGTEWPERPERPERLEIGTRMEHLVEHSDKLMECSERSVPFQHRSARSGSNQISGIVIPEARSNSPFQPFLERSPFH